MEDGAAVREAIDGDAYTVCDVPGLGVKESFRRIDCAEV
jgi:hypothetical protein